jgi:nucleoredoxin
MTWLTLDYDDRDLKEKLSKQYKVQGIPTLVILDSNAQLVAVKGRSFIGQKSFPFTPPTVSSSLGATLLKKVDGKVTEVATKDALAGKNVALYFSAHWCPPCRRFTPSLAKTYKNMKKLVSDGELEDNFEFVFVSSDREESAFNDYFDEMPWLALPYSNREGKADLSGIFDINGIPSLVTLDPSGKVINKSARGAASADPDGLMFPWAPEPVDDINKDQDGLNEETCVIALLGGATDAEKKARLADINAVGKKFFDEAKSKGKDPEFRFFYSNTDGGIVGQIRKLTQIGDGAKTIILDIPDNGGFYVADKEGDVGALLAAYKSKKLKRKQLSRS